MVSGQMSGGPLPAAAPSAAPWARTVPQATRLAVSFLVGLGGVLLAAAAFSSSGWSWLLWIAAGLAAGAVAGRLAFLWIAPVVVIAFYPIAGWLGLTEDLGPFWMIGAVIGMALIAAGFAAGTMIGWRQPPAAAVSTGWRRLSKPWRALVVAVILLFVAGLAGYSAYLGVVGSQSFAQPSTNSANCATPMSRFGWAYEAINYDPADDAALAAANPDRGQCASQGAPAGTALVTSDGVRLDGWYIPAAGSVGATGPTLLVVPGFNSNKSDALLFAPAFHERYNLVLLDLRHQGRSSPADVTFGQKEQLDIRAAIDWIQAEKHPTAIAVMGNSMGAAALVAEARTDPRVGALILDSMHANWETMAGNALETDYGQPSVPGAAVIHAAYDLRTGGNVSSVDPVKTIAELGNRPVLLLHSTTDKIDPPAVAAERNLHAALDAGVPAQLEYCQGLSTGNGSHGHVIDQCPATWARLANQFLDAALSS